MIWKKTEEPAVTWKELQRTLKAAICPRQSFANNKAPKDGE